MLNPQEYNLTLFFFNLLQVFVIKVVSTRWASIAMDKMPVHTISYVYCIIMTWAIATIRAFFCIEDSTLFLIPPYGYWSK